MLLPLYNKLKMFKNILKLKDSESIKVLASTISTNTEAEPIVYATIVIRAKSPLPEIVKKVTYRTIGPSFRPEVV